MTWVSLSPNLLLLSCAKSEKKYAAICRYIEISGRFGPVLPKNRVMGLFPKNRALSVFSPLTPCKESEKTNEPILRKVGK